MKRKSILLIFLSVIFSNVESARILGVFQMPSVSHQCVFQPIWKELSLRGHEVVVVTPNPIKDPSLVNLTEIDMPNFRPKIMKAGFQFFMNKQIEVYKKIQEIFSFSTILIEDIFKDERFKKYYQDPNEKFDLIIIQIYINPIMHALGAKFNAPVVGVSSMGGYIGSQFGIGNPHPPSLYSEMFLPYHGLMSFKERIYSTLYYIWARFYVHFHILPESDRIAKKYLGEDLPYIGELEKNLSMLFLTTNPVLYEPRANVPIVRSMTSLHVKPPKPLPKKLKKFMDESKEGIIYFSLGSNVQSVNLSENLRNIFIETFSELPYKIIWKWEGEDLPNKPSNVFTGKWLPQQDILAHPNVKVFITQCGLQSLEETFSRGVPIVGIPMIADQEMNIKRLEALGAGIEINYLTVTKEELKRAIIKVASNDSYKKKIIEIGQYILDTPLDSLNETIWWMEYIIRHKGNKHLRSPTVDIGWIQYLLLDVIALFLAVLILIYLIFKKLLNLIFSSKTSKIKQNKNKKIK